jgi:hypothetical protein
MAIESTTKGGMSQAGLFSTFYLISLHLLLWRFGVSESAPETTCVWVTKQLWQDPQTRFQRRAERGTRKHIRDWKEDSVKEPGEKGGEQRVADRPREEQQKSHL